MQTDNGLFAGAFAAWVVTYLMLGGYFIGAYLARRRDTDYLVFGLLTLALAVHSAGLGLHYQQPTPERWRFAHLVANGGGAVAIALGIHFGVIVRGVAHPRRVVAPTYAIAGAFIVALFAGLWFDVDHAQTQVVRTLGGTFLVVRAPIRPIGLAFMVLAAIAAFAVTVLLGLAFRGGRRDNAGAFIGSMVVLVGVSVDALATLRAAEWVHLTPHAYIVFAFGVATTLLGRYRLLSRQLEERTADLERRTADLIDSCDELSVVRDELLRKQQLAAVGEMAAVVAHEVRNPIAIIQNALANLRRPGTALADRETLLVILDEESERLKAIVSDLLTYVRPVVVARERIDVVDLMDRAIATLPLGSGVEVVGPGCSNMETYGDPVLLRQALDNVLTNAAQAMPSGGKLTVNVERGVRAGSPCTIVYVTDTGEGMSPGVLARAKAPFFTTRPTGTGLGLAIVTRILDAHGGSVEIMSEPGAGTTVRIVLPHSPSSMPDAEPARLGEPAA